MKNAERALYLSAAVWTVLGLLSGLYYRELTRSLDYSGPFVQLSVGHTHALALGTTVLLIVLTLTRVFRLGADARLRWFTIAYNVGLGITFTMLNFKGTLQVLGNPIATHKAIAGISGLGHITLAASFALLFVILGRALKGSDTPDAASALAPVAAKAAH